MYNGTLIHPLQRSVIIENGDTIWIPKNLLQIREDYKNVVKIEDINWV